MKKQVMVLSRHMDEHQVLTVSKNGEGYEVAVKASASNHEEAIKQFQAQADYTVGSSLVMNLPASCSLVHHFTVPVVANGALPALVAMQAETLLPLPPDRMVLSWRNDEMENGEIPITLVAGRRDYLEQLKQSAESCRDVNIISDYVAAAQACRTFYEPRLDDGVVILCRPQCTLVLQLHKGKMVRGTCLDYGLEELARDQQPHLSTLERLAQDVRNVWEKFNQQLENPISVHMPVEDETTRQIAVFLRSTDILVKELHFRSGLVSAASDVSFVPSQHLTSLGAAVAALNDSAEELCFHSPPQAVSSSSWRGVPPAWPVSLMVLVLIALTYLLVAYRSDVARRDQLEHLFKQSAYATRLDTLTQKQQLRHFVAGQRPDVLDMLEHIQTVLPEEMLLDKITYRRGQRLRIEGHTKKPDDILAFQENLQKSSDFNNVQSESETFNAQKEYTTFILSCDYKYFTRKQ
ncbi:MAG: PilN domain-containing protein [Sedimentisphaerales bacterium]|nr:PilN domain-containing protein [Sedimentisphaerales bacterium]